MICLKLKGRPNMNSVVIGFKQTGQEIWFYSGLFQGQFRFTTYSKSRTLNGPVEFTSIYSSVVKKFVWL